MFMYFIFNGFVLSFMDSISFFFFFWFCFLWFEMGYFWDKDCEFVCIYVFSFVSFSFYGIIGFLNDYDGVWVVNCDVFDSIKKLRN